MNSNSWFYSARDTTHAISLCRGHSYLAARTFRPGAGTLSGLDAPPTLCCVCAGTATIRRMKGAPLKLPPSEQQGPPAEKVATSEWAPGDLANNRIAYEMQGRPLLSACRLELDDERNPRVYAVGFPDPVASDYSYATEGSNSRLEKAWEILAGAPAPWKNVEMLRTLRQAVREWHVQMMPIDLPPDRASRRAVESFLREARVFDRIHHGAQTF